MKILAADRNKGVREALCEQLQQWGHEVVEAETGKEAMKRLYLENPPGIALLNWTLPEMDGPDICRRVLESDNVPFIYTILMTANKTDEEIVQTLDRGVCDFISKPVNKAVLKSRISVGERMLEADKKLKHYARELDNYAKELKRLSITDYLTGAYSRRYFFEQAILELERARRYDRQMSVVLIDIDHFKQINELFGNLAGDEVLMVLTENAGLLLRKTDLMARYGGEEFVILLPETDGKGAYKLSERLRKTVSNMRVELPENEIQFTVSIGVAEIRTQDETVEEIIGRANEGLMAAKAGGRNKTKLIK